MMGLSTSPRRLRSESSYPLHAHYDTCNVAVPQLSLRNKTSVQTNLQSFMFVEETISSVQVLKVNSVM